MSAPVFEMRLRVPLDKFDLAADWTSHRRVVGLFGPSGSGKTTFLEAVAGLRRAATGFIRCDGRVWLESERGTKLPAEARGIGYVPQDHLLFPHHRVRGNLEFGRRRARLEGRDFEAVFAEVVDVLELGPLLTRRVTELSGGERQRVALGRALCSGPRLLMLDEPLASLDIELRHRILPFLLRVRDHFEIPILVVSHNPVELLALCEEVIALRAGQIVAQGTPTDVLTRADLYPSAAREGFENMLPATVAEHRRHATVVRLGAGGDAPAVTIPRIERPLAAQLTIGIPANDILVATQPVEGISARNFLRARVLTLREVEHKVVLTVELTGCDGPAIVIELTETAVEELTLAAGAHVWLVIKSSAIAAYG